MTVDGQSTLVDAVIIEGCNDAQFTVIRSEAEAAETDTLYLNLAGSAQLGLDYAENFNQVIMGPGQVESTITLGVVDDGFNEGIETAEITYEYINGCGELISTTSLVVIVDPIPIEAIPATGVPNPGRGAGARLHRHGRLRTVQLRVGRGFLGQRHDGPQRGPRRSTRCLS